MAGQTPKKLKLLIKDQDDLALVSGLMQDALLVVQDMQIDLEAGNFIAVFSRFMWEAATLADVMQNAAAEQSVLSGPNVSKDTSATSEDADARFEDVPSSDQASHYRVHSALRIEGLRAAQTRRLPTDPKAVINLLSVTQPDAQHILLTFSEGAGIRLRTEGLRATLEDLGEPWPTLYRPDHGQAD